MAHSARNSAITSGPTRCRSGGNSRAMASSAAPPHSRGRSRRASRLRCRESQASSDPEHHQKFADHVSGRNLLPRQPTAVNRFALRTSFDQGAFAHRCRTRARQQPAECSSEDVLGDLWRNRIGQLAGARRPPHRHLVTGRGRGARMSGPRPRIDKAAAPDRAAARRCWRRGRNPAYRRWRGRHRKHEYWDEP